MTTSPMHDSLLGAGKVSFIDSEINYATAVEGVDRYQYDTVDPARTNLSLARR
jgi:hypothetical protein